jgi:hypothetical protein
MWTQIVGKTRMKLEPLVNHWWNVALYVTPAGLTTSAIPYAGKTFEVDFDFNAHRLTIVTSDGRLRAVPLYARSVADFYEEYMSALQSLGIQVQINTVPAEFDDLTPHDQDRHHASYDADAVGRFHRVLLHSEKAFKKFRARFIGKCSPVHFFWGSFDLAVTRFSGRRAPEQPNADPITREGYSHEVSSCGFWPGDRRFKNAAYYSYAAPTPAGMSEQRVRPPAAYWDTQVLNEFILKYEDVRSAGSPQSDIQGFCQSTYEAAANLAKWDRAALER